MLRIDIEDSEVIERTSKAGKPYHQQIAYVYTVGRDGPNRHPEKIFLFCQKNDGKPVALPKGRYQLRADSLRVKNCQLEIGFINLEPLKG